MSSRAGNPFWKVGKRGSGLPRKLGEVIIEEKGGVPSGRSFDPSFPDREWIGPAQQGGGRVPASDNWTYSAKENQDRSMGDSTKRLK